MVHIFLFLETFKLSEYAFGHVSVLVRSLVAQQSLRAIAQVHLVRVGCLLVGVLRSLGANGRQQLLTVGAHVDLLSGVSARQHVRILLMPMTS